MLDFVHASLHNVFKSISWAKAIWGSIIFWIMGSEPGVGWRAKWSDRDLEENVKIIKFFDRFPPWFLMALRDVISMVTPSCPVLSCPVLSFPFPYFPFLSFPVLSFPLHEPIQGTNTMNQYKESVQWTNTMNQYNEPIQWTNTRNQYNEPIQCTKTMTQYNDPIQGINTMN